MSRRLTRLLLVIVPALFLTLAWDKLGLALTHGMGYDGRYRELYTVGPEPDMLNHALGTFVGNLVFLQTIQVPIFGSNGPMWSLANEFWYYVVFPLAAWILMPGIAPGRRLAGAALLSILGILLPRELLVYGLIWVSGAAASFLLFRFSLAKIWNKRSLQFLAVVCIFSVLVASKFSSTGMDFIIGFAVAAALPFLARLPSPGGLYAFVARATSELSYTLYLTHMPLLTLVVFATLAPFRLPPDLTGFGLFLFLLLILAAWAAAIWWCFERHTDRMFRLIVSRFRL